MADRAVGGEEFLALDHVAGLLDLGRELGDERVLLLRFRPAQFRNDRGGAFRNFCVGMQAQAMRVGRSEQRQRHRAGIKRIDQRHRPRGTLEQLVERRRLRGAVHAGQRLDQCGSHRIIGQRAERFDHARLECGRRAVFEQPGHGRQNLSAHLAHPEQRRRHFRARVVGHGFVRQLFGQFADFALHVARQRARLIPSHCQRQRGGGDACVPGAYEFLQRRLEFGRERRRGELGVARKRVEHRHLHGVLRRGPGRERDDQLGRFIRTAARDEHTGDRCDERGVLRRVGTGDGGFEEERGSFCRHSHEGRLRPRIVERGINADERVRHFGIGRGLGQREQGFETDAGVGVLRELESGSLGRGLGHGGDLHGVLAHGVVGVTSGNGQSRGIGLAETGQRPERRHAGLRCLL